ncbi:MAG: 3-dehydroquinate synthase family protein, partial [Gaiellaceae bacterium]
RDPFDRGARAALNLGHTFAHALEAGADFAAVSHGEAVALGLLAALRLSGNTPGVEAVERVLRPHPVRVDRERAWAALRRDKKLEQGVVQLVLLEASGGPVTRADLPDEDVRRALDALIAG